MLSLQGNVLLGERCLTAVFEFVEDFYLYSAQFFAHTA